MPIIVQKQSADDPSGDCQPVIIYDLGRPALPVLFSAGLMLFFSYTMSCFVRALVGIASIRQPIFLTSDHSVGPIRIGNHNYLIPYAGIGATLGAMLYFASLYLVFRLWRFSKGSWRLWFGISMAIVIILGLASAIAGWRFQIPAYDGGGI